MGNIFSQLFFISVPTLTEKNCPDQAGRVSDINSLDDARDGHLAILNLSRMSDAVLL